MLVVVETLYGLSMYKLTDEVLSDEVLEILGVGKDEERIIVRLNANYQYNVKTFNAVKHKNYNFLKDSVKFWRKTLV